MGILRLVHRYLVRQTMPAMSVRYYDHLIDSVADFYLTPFCNDIESAFQSPATIIDIGTGTGQLPVMLARANPQYRIIGMDLSEECLCKARQNAKDAGVSDRVRFMRINLGAGNADLPAADLAVSTCSLHHWRHPDRMLRAISNLLKPSGQIWIMDDFGDASNDARRDWIERVENAAHAGWLFPAVFQFESRHLAYKKSEFENICHRAGLRLLSFESRDVFFIARLQKII